MHQGYGFTDHRFGRGRSAINEEMKALNLGPPSLQFTCLMLSVGVGK